MQIPALLIFQTLHFFITSLSPRACQVFYNISAPRACQVCSPIHPNPSPFLRPFILRWVVARRGRTPDLTFNTLLTRQMLPISMNGRRKGEGLGCIHSW